MSSLFKNDFSIATSLATGNNQFHVICSNIEPKSTPIDHQVGNSRHSSNPPFFKGGIGFPENGLKGGIEDFGF